MKARALRSAAMFVALFGLALAFADQLRPPAARLAALAAGAALELVEFGTGGRAELRPGIPPGRPEGDITPDTTLILTKDGLRGSQPVAVSLWRDVCIPLILTAAIIASVPLSLRIRGLALALGLPMVAAWVFGLLWLTAAWILTLSIRDVYDTQSWVVRAIDLSYRSLILPPAARVIYPVFAAGTALALARVIQPRRSSRRSSSTSDAA